MRKQNRVSVVFLGDGAADEGVLYESINFAILKKLPVIYVYENNQLSVCSRVSARQAGDIIFHATPAENMLTKTVDGNAVLEVYEVIREAVSRARNGWGPSFIECKTYRMRGHAGVGSDAGLGYRSAEEISSWESKCPVSTFSEELLQERLLTEKDIQNMEENIDNDIDEAFRFAQESPLPKGENILKYLFSE